MYPSGGGGRGRHRGLRRRVLPTAPHPGHLQRPSRGGALLSGPAHATTGPTARGATDADADRAEQGRGRRRRRLMGSGRYSLLFLTYIYLYHILGQPQSLSQRSKQTVYGVRWGSWCAFIEGAVLPTYTRCTVRT